MLQGNWRDIIPYDAEMRKVFAIKPHLSFANFESKELDHVKAMAWPTGPSSRAQAALQGGSSRSLYVKPPAKRPKLSRTSQSSAFKIKPSSHLPHNQQVCGGWNVGKCQDPPKCGRIHGVCDVVGCFESHKRTAHPK